MSETYQKWHHAGADFHFVSASPWQLINPLCQLMQEKKFPDATFNLRIFRWRDQVFKRVVSEKWIGKAKVIRRIVERFPDRGYVLIGDSVERDPELYAHLAEKFEGQIKAIYIRQVPEYEISSLRIDRIRSQISNTVFETFQDCSDLPEELPF